jgi:hypothetical protein
MPVAKLTKTRSRIGRVSLVFMPCELLLPAAHDMALPEPHRLPLGDAFSEIAEGVRRARINIGFGEESGGR